VSERWKFGAGPKGRGPLFTKSVSIPFEVGSDQLYPNARKLIDEVAETVAQFGNTYVRVEGNTDSKGLHAPNVVLSRRRALAIVAYLVAQHGFDRARFQAIGNGPDKPVADNATAQGREMNRRTDFVVIPNE
jgi:outer membrane protein OmpA-like peptidoglycan-associated protein